MPRQKKTEKTALMQAVDLLARQEQSEQRLTEKLRHRGYEETEIHEAVDYLKDRNYLDDRGACERQFRFLYEESRNSVRQICMKLMQRGFSASLVRECVPEDIFEREKQAALKCLRLKFRNPPEPQKMMQYLYQKGFDGSALRAAAEELAESAALEENI